MSKEREIKFRAFYYDRNLGNNEMIYGSIMDFIMWKDEYRVKWVDIIEENGNDCDLMQYTGLKDKNGKEIYEGDIVVTTYIDGAIPEVVEYGGWSSNAVHGVYGYVFNESTEGDTWLVLGNIHENPELIPEQLRDYREEK